MFVVLSRCFIADVNYWRVFPVGSWNL